ncbi:alpha-L-fucosidase [Agromyces sp. ISL-38]|uniref:alpha-L-fucosidase n=1 Tax=Agromyces sp. ISL-38 TaxID=2819107 RepID=UPI001BE6820E|nr:alpha-L-fucosidase [Agromyces sp. ISL-38]MBT2500792.1 alpha-L-fucosidase [Agromyces sp. ISL-38]
MPQLPPINPADLPDRVDISDNSAEVARVRETATAGPYQPTWDSLRGYQPPLWYQDGKFGVFLHWGVFSVPAFGTEWYSRTMYLEGTEEFEHHVATYGPHRKFGYKDFIPSFTMEHFDPDDWAQLFKRAGAQFVVPVAEHHDGFAMYDTGRSRWSAAQMGPRSDVFGQLGQAVERAWMVVGASSHRAEHWFFMNGGARFDSDVRDPAWFDFYGPAQREEIAPNERFLEDWLLRCVEIIDKYRPQILYFDWWIESPAFEPYLRLLAAYYYNSAHQRGREVVINFKWDAFAAGSAVYDIERGAMGGIQDSVWQSDTSVSRTSWSWVEGHEYKNVNELIAELADTVSKNGVLLLNIGPKSDGTIPDEERRLLEGIGTWLTRNGEAIYGSRPWIIPAEGPTELIVGSFVDASSPQYTSADIRFTTRAHVTGDYLYATLLAHPEDGVARIRSFGSGAGLLTRGIQEVSVLGSTEKVAWHRSSESLDVTLPPTTPDLGGGPVVKCFLEPDARPPRVDFLHG